MAEFMSATQEHGFDPWPGKIPCLWGIKPLATPPWASTPESPCSYKQEEPPQLKKPEALQQLESTSLSSPQESREYNNRDQHSQSK